MEVLTPLTTLLMGAIIAWFLRPFVASYSKQKGQNLATKEDVEEITRKVEGIRKEISVDLEVIKWELSKKATVHRLVAEKEFEALTEISKALYDLHFATSALRPIVDFALPDETPADRYNRRFKRWAQSHDTFSEVIEKSKLFLPVSLYAQLAQILRVARSEGLSFQGAVNTERTTGKEVHEGIVEGLKNIEKLNAAIEDMLSTLRNRYGLEDLSDISTLQKNDNALIKPSNS